MIVTARRIPVPDPIAPMKSAKMERAPMQIPPNAAATGIYLLSYFTMESSLIPSITSSWSMSYLTTSLELDPDTSIQILEKNAHELNTKIV
jgi:hypothetical protein